MDTMRSPGGKQDSYAKTCFLYAILGVLLLAAFELPYVIQGMDSHVRIQDNLDAFPVAYAASHFKAFENQKNPFSFMFGGHLPKEAISLEPDVILALYGLFSPPVAYLFNDWMCRVVGFLGMFFLLAAIARRPLWLCFAAAIVFATMPFTYTSFEGLSLLGIPFLILIVFRFLKEEPPGIAFLIFSILYSILFAFYASLAWTGFFLLPGVFFAWLLIAVVRRRLLPGLLVVACILLAGYVAANWAFLRDMLSQNPTRWHREEIVSHIPFAEVFQRGILMPIQSQYHAAANPAFLWLAIFLYSVWALLNSVRQRLGKWHRLAALAVLFVSACACIYLFLVLKHVGMLTGTLLILAPAVYVTIVRKRAGEPDPQEAAPAPAAGSLPVVAALVALILFIGVFSILYRIVVQTPSLRAALEMLPVVGKTQLDRLYFLLPILFAIANFLALGSLLLIRRAGFFLVGILLVLQVASNVENADWLAERDQPTVAEYFSRGAFDEAARLIGTDREDLRIACLGFHPAIAHYNRFATIDGYWPVYPLSYKHEFRTIIAGELEKSDTLRRYFDDWGHRCYVMSAEIGINFMVTKSSPIREVRNLAINVNAMRELGGEYLFSSVPIANAPDLGLSLLGRASADDSAFALYVYEIPPESDKKPASASNESP